MIKENVNGIATPIKKLFEYVNGTKQEVKERYEYVDGRKELVFKNKTIKEIQLVDANGNPLNGMSGGVRYTTDPVLRNTYGLNYEFGGPTVYSPYTSVLLGLGNATNKKIKNIKLKVGAVGAYLQNDSESTPANISFVLLDNTNQTLRTLSPIYYQSSGTISGYRRFGYSDIASNSINIDMDRVLTGIKMRYTSTHGNFAGSPRDNGTLKFGIRDFIITYEE